MHHVMGVAVTGVAAGELTLVAIPALEGAAQGGRDGAGSAAAVEDLAVGGVAQHHEAGIAGDAARGGCREVDAGCLLDDRQAGVGSHCRGRGLRGRRAACGRFLGNCARQSLEWGEVM